MSATTRSWLQCSTCGFEAEMGVYPDGCPACQRSGRVSALLVQYRPQPAWPALPVATAGIWARWGQFLPAIPIEHQRSLGEGQSPLIRHERLSDLTGFPNLYLKTEGVNPTGSHKDRFHAVSVAVARTLGKTGVVSASTGNHGLSMSGYAGLHGLNAVVMAHERMPELLQRAIGFSGGLPLSTSASTATSITRSLIDSGHWMPAGTLWPMPFANPYGVEGYKTIAYEITESLGHPPDWILVPTAGGDLLCGIWRGIHDLERATGSTPRTRLVACQPEGAAPLVEAHSAGLDHVPRLDQAHSIALSIADPITGDLALRAVRQTEGAAIAVSDQSMLEAGRQLARFGVLAEPSSVAPVAALRQLGEQYPESREQTVVCVLTSSALKWLDDYGDSAAETSRGVATADQALKLIANRFGDSG